MNKNKTYKNKTRKNKGGYISQKKQSVKQTSKQSKKSVKSLKSSGQMATILPLILNK